MLNARPPRPTHILRCRRAAAAALLAAHHRDGLALEVDVGVAAHVDRDPVDDAAGELAGVSGVVRGHRVAAVATDAQALAADGELARLRLDAALPDLDVAVKQRKRAERDAGRVLALLLERGGQDQLLTGRQWFVGDDPLLRLPDEAVDVAQAAVLDVKRV